VDDGFDKKSAVELRERLTAADRRKSNLIARKIAHKVIWVSRAAGGNWNIAKSPLRESTASFFRGFRRILTRSTTQLVNSHSFQRSIKHVFGSGVSQFSHRYLGRLPDTLLYQPACKRKQR
jgi:hypothetical protein